MSVDTARAVATLRSLTRKFDEGVETAAPFYPQICTVVPSDGADEEYGAIGSMPTVREWLGDRQMGSLRGAKFTIRNREWENSLRIEKNDIADDRMALYGMALADLGAQAALHPDSLVFQLMMAAASALCFDGQYFFDTDHLWGDSGSQSNALTYTAATGTAPTADEFRGAFHQARAAMLGFKRDNGEYYVQPTIRPLPNLLCVVPPAMELAAVEAFERLVRGSGESNVVLDAPKVVASPLMSDAAKFQIYNLGGRLKPFVFQARRPLSRQMKGLDDAEFKDVKFMCDARYNAGYLAWWSAVETTFT